MGAVPQKQSPGLAERKEKGIVGPRRSGGTGGWVGPGAGLGQGAGWGLVGRGSRAGAGARSQPTGELRRAVCLLSSPLCEAEPWDFRPHVHQAWAEVCQWDGVKR